MMSATTIGDVAVELREAFKAYGETQALAGVTLEARFGEIHAVVGENGSGKSTLVKILSGVLDVDRGTVRIAGTAPRSAAPKELHRLGLATVFQEVLLVEPASVLDNVWLGYDGLLRSRLGPEEKRTRVRALLDRLGQADIPLDVPVESVPLSAQQWVVIARALIRRPRILILDESTAALDLANAATLSHELKRLREAGTCILLITHRIKELTELADRATVLREGRHVGLLTGDQITERRLLELMTGAASSDRAIPVSAGRARADGTVLLQGTDLRIAPDSRPFSFTLRAGEVVGLAGLEGHGHADLIEILGGRRTAAGGETSAGGPSLRRYSTAREAARLGIAYVPGDRKTKGIFPHLAIAENFGLPAFGGNTLLGFLRPRAIAARFRSAAEQLSLKFGRAGDAVTTLSGGNQQKVLVARALASEPAVLLLHDPTRGVDPRTKQDLYAVLRDLARRGVGVVFLSSELEELAQLCDRVVVFHGRTIEAELDHRDASPDRLLAALFGVTGDAVEAELEAVR